jgi:hypothetical protein
MGAKRRAQRDGSVLPAAPVSRLAQAAYPNRCFA